MHDWKKAFGEPDAAFEQRVQRTLRRIQEKEEAKVKKKLTLSIAVAFALCLTVLTLSALAATDFLGVIKPDVTLSPLSQSTGDADPTMDPVKSTPTPAVTMVPTDTPMPSFPPMQTVTPMPTAELIMAMSTPMPFPASIPAASDELQVYYHEEGSEDYHENPYCSQIVSDHFESFSAAEVAALELQACTACYPLPYYTTRNDDFYHETHMCLTEGSPDVPFYAIPITAEVAKASGRKLCLECLYTDGLWYYATEQGTFFHDIPDCSGMQGAAYTHLSELSALGKQPCPECLTEKVYVSESGPYYHSVTGCYGVSELKETGSKEAEISGKDPCPVCMKELYYFTPDHNKTTPYYHVSPDCSRAALTAPGTLVSARKFSKEPCPECIGEPVYCTPHGTYYHTDASCSGMVRAEEIPVAYAEDEMGKKACPVCAVSIPMATPVPGKGDYYYSSSDAYFHSMTSCPAFAHSEGKTNAAKLEALGKLPCEKCVGATFYVGDSPYSFYHSVLGCFGEWELTAISSDVPEIEYYTPCPQCIEALYYFLNAVDAQHPYFHVNPACPEMSAVEQTRGSMNDAFAMGKVACPECTQMYYCNLTGNIYYHASASCPSLEPETAGMVLEGTALNMGKDACPFCTVPEPTEAPAPAVSSGSSTVYNSSNGFYHTIPDCPQLMRYGDPGQTTEMMALAAGSIVCDQCARCYVEDEINEMYHMDKNCPNLCEPFSSVIWMDIMNIGAGLEYSGCTTCTFFSEKEDSFYHSNMECAEQLTGGTNLFPGTEAYMLRIGKTPCPDCTPAMAEAQPTQTPLSADQNPAGTDGSATPASPDSFPLNLDTPQSGYSEEMRVINFVVEGFEEGFYSADGNGVPLQSFSNEKIELHSYISLVARGCVYIELEFSLNDPSILPESVRVTAADSNTGAALDWKYAELKEITYDNGVTRYLLCETMDAPAPAFPADILRIYGGASEEDITVIADFR